MIDEDEKRRVTLNDVVNALKNGDQEISPFDTNAAKIREVIGYGSNQTIQKHLAKLRDDLNKERLRSVIGHTDTTTPEAPKDLLNRIWEEAWVSAQLKNLSRIEVLTIEKENLLQTVAAQTADIEILTNLNDELEYSVVSIKNDAEAIKGKIEAMDADFLKLSEEKDKEIISLKEELQLVKKDALHARELADRDAAIAKSAMQATIDKLNEQVSELKAFRMVITAEKPGN